ncbi:2,3-dihydro-2,3-dihydroxybenzoate dehydrogenase [Roseibium sp. RKSG952]|uniref:2,3-dihydro-2,3-dihydroxybenzoate dehydrogenase n=1 Tax=Roseibium sp. RKSG952 TaxID=2529384 RepID=UPI0012BD6FE7|nr:2,3-dihydro-2,3-dihydroxybenzoate dehydrogenase [Roseibium sp. RKSG952]MTH96593.1 2,3-dihydro-2,3-dihydroxybenzoate dehydrogenase [Roseibium sp. RKSG952]
MTYAQFSGRRVVVTGAASGIGRRIAERFSGFGADVTGLDKQADISGLPYRLLGVDLTAADQVKEVCDILKAERNGIDVLVNAAGVLRTGATEDLSVEDWQACINVNASGPFYLLSQWIPVFKAQRRGAIVNIASNAAHVPRMGMTAYCASKSAMASLSHCVGLELAPFGIRSNLVSPGSTDTPMLRDMAGGPQGYAALVSGLPGQFKSGIPLGKVARVDDIAETVLFLASDQAGHITLQDIVVDGGATLGA